MTTITAEDMEQIMKRMSDHHMDVTGRILKEIMSHQADTAGKHQEQLLAAVGDKSKGEGRKESMPGRRAFTALPTYSGKPEEFDLWRFQLLQFLSAEPGFPAFIE